MKKRIVSSAIIVSLLVAYAAPVFADAKMEKRIAKDYLARFGDFFNDMAAMQSMDDVQKVNYIMTKGEKRIKDKTYEKFKDKSKEKLKDFAKKQFRAYYFQQSIPSIGGELLVDNFDKMWPKMEADIASKADTSLRAFSTGLDLTWNVYDEMRKGSYEGISYAIIGEGSKLMAQAYIPGWHILVVSKDVLTAVRDYVLAYANETAKIGKFDDMYPEMKRNPEAFAKWLYNKTPGEIVKDVNDKWELVEFDSRVFVGKGTEAGQQEMKQKIIDMLILMRGEILAKMKDQQRLEQIGNQYAQEAKQAFEELRKIGYEATNEANGYIEKINDYNKLAVNASKSLAQEEFQELKSEAERYKQPFASIDRSPLSILTSMLQEVKESGTNGYDASQLNAEEYIQAKRGAINKAVQQAGSTNYIDLSAYYREEYAIIYEAKARADIMNEFLKVELQKIQTNIETAAQDLEENKVKIDNEIRNGLNYPGIYNTFVEPSNNLSGQIYRGFVLSSMDLLESPQYEGMLVEKYYKALDAKELLIKDMSMAQSITSKEIASYDKYELALNQANIDFNTIAPKNLINENPNDKREKYIAPFFLYIYDGIGGDVNSPSAGFIPEYSIKIPKLDEDLKNRLKNQSSHIANNYQNALSVLNKEIQDIEPLIDQDNKNRIMVNITYNILWSALFQKFLLNESMTNLERDAFIKFHTKDGELSFKDDKWIDIDPETSDAHKYLQDLKAQYEIYKPYIDYLAKLKNEFKNSVHYNDSSVHDTTRIFDDADMFIAIPERIAYYQRQYDLNKTVYDEILKRNELIKEQEQAFKKLKIEIDKTYKQKPTVEQVNTLSSMLKSVNTECSMILTEPELKSYVEKIKKYIEDTTIKLNNNPTFADDEANTATIKQMYEQFEQAYESKNLSSLMNLIGDSWSADDGTALTELENYLDKGFMLFDSISLDISSFNMTKISPTVYKVSYDVLIKGVIYQDNISHSEKSRVEEEVSINDKGKAKITRTLGGRFWYIE